ncbi:MAG: hypothetical protein JHC41_09430 [Nitrosopumilus sp.]|jgi:hypothetical protein|nr:hypothetical protein [Nitrosopumilus sp.]
MRYPNRVITKTLCLYFDDLSTEICSKSLKHYLLDELMLDPKNTDSLKLKEMQELLEKEKNLHRKIRRDYKKISDKINNDFDQIKKSKSSD